MVRIMRLEDLISDKDLSEDILRAYGEGSTGVIGVRGIPNWTSMTTKTLPLAHTLATLPDAKKDALEDATSMYNAGWSFGKEKMGDKPDFAKASFYFNPLTDNPSPELRQEFPWALPANLWPEEEDIPNFKSNCCEIGYVMKEVATLLAKHIDFTLTAQVPGYQQGLFYSAIKESIKAKARMLYYFPIPPEKMQDPAQTDNWIAWHNDSGFLTCLAGEVFVDHASGRIIDNPEPESAGLWIADRDGQEIKVTIPGDCLGVQMGECLQIISGGLLVATPHCVRGCANTPGVARASLPCFVDTHVTFPLAMPQGCSREAVFRHTVAHRVPPLADRWTSDGVKFADFLGDTFRGYYEWALSKST